MLKKIKIFSAPILFGVVFLLIIASTVLYFHNFAQAGSGLVDLGLTSASFTLDPNNSQLVHYKATVKNTGQKASDQYYYNYEKIAGRKVSFSVLNSNPKIEICSVTIPVIQPNGVGSVECTSSYVPSNSNDQVEAKITATAGDPNIDNVATYPMYPVFVSIFTQFPSYYNPVATTTPAQSFTVNVKNTGFPLRSNVPDGISIGYSSGGYSATPCKTNLIFSQANSSNGQNFSCTLTLDNNANTRAIANKYYDGQLIFIDAYSSANKTQRIKTGAPNLSVSSGLYCGEKLNLGSPVTCDISIVNNGGFYDGTSGFIPIDQTSLTKGLSVSASFLDLDRHLIGVADKEVCSLVFSVNDVLILNTSGGTLTKQCVIPSANIPAGAMFVNTKAALDPNNIVKEINENNNISIAREVNFQGQDATQVVNLTVSVDPIVNLLGLKTLFQEADGYILRATCFGPTCSVNLPPGNYKVLPSSTFIECSAPDCPLYFQVADRAVSIELKVKSTALPANDFCTDSDANETAPNFVQGAVRAYSRNSQTFSGGKDNCQGNILKEYSCSGNTFNSSASLICANGCYNGACAQNCATLFGIPDLQCKTLIGIEAFKQQCPNQEVVYDKLPRVGQYCSKTGGDYCVQCKPECEKDVDCKDVKCLITGEEPFCSSQKCACRKSLPDLTITSALTCPKSLYSAGDSISGCSITIKNTGLATTLVPPKIDLNEVSGAPRQLNQITQPAVLGKNASAMVVFGNFNFTTPGIYKFKACVDYSNTITESNEGNNCSDELSIEIKPSAVLLPDLTITGTLTCPHASYNVGEVISGCSITIKNIGTAPTTVTPKTNLYDSSWKLLSQVATPGVLGQNVSNVITFGNFNFATPGIYNIHACVDDDPKEITESNEDNNCSATLSLEIKPITISLPDLTIGDSGLACSPVSISSGGATSCSVPIKNIGLASTLISPKTNLYDVTNSLRWKQLKQVAHSGVLGVNSSTSINFGNLDFTAPGTYKLRVCVDLDPNEIAESNEDNNCSAVVSLIVASPTTQCSLAPTGGDTCANFSCPPNQKPQCIDAMCVCKDVVVPTQPIIVVSPNGGEIFVIDQTYTLTWQTNGLNSDSRFKVQVCTDQSMPICVSANSGVLLPITQTNLSWTIPANIFASFGAGISANDRFKIRVSEILANNSTGALDMSDNNLSIALAPLPTTNCAPIFGTGWFCGTEADRVGQCRGGGTLKVLPEKQICNQNGTPSCVSCAITECSSDSGCSTFPCGSAQTPQCLNGQCSCRDGVVSPLIPAGGSGTVSLPIGGGTAVMIIPAGTFTVPVIAGIKSALDSASNDIITKLSALKKVLIGKPTDFSITKNDGTNATFASIPIEIHYTDAQIVGISEDSLKLYMYSGGTLESLATTIHKDTKTLTAQAKHFSAIVTSADYAKGVACLPCCETTNCGPNNAALGGYTCIGADKSKCKRSGNAVPYTFSGSYGECQIESNPVLCSLTKFDNPDDLIKNVSGWIFKLALIIAPLMILLGGFYLLTAGGEPRRATQGKQIITWVIIGLAVILTAKAFISIITSVLK